MSLDARIHAPAWRDFQFEAGPINVTLSPSYYGGMAATVRVPVAVGIRRVTCCG